jgi:hypothetical protein
MTGLALIGMTAVFAVAFSYNQRLMMSFLAFSCGIIGGFVSIQQRLKAIGQEELALLAQSWFQIVLVPIFGGVFALVLYCMFLSGLVAGDIFPAFFSPAAPDGGPNSAYMQSILTQTYPNSGPDLAKFIFWSFVAGFSERFVLNFVDSAAARASPEKPVEGAAVIEDERPSEAPSTMRPIPLNPVRTDGVPPAEQR